MQANDVAKALKSWLAIYITEKEYANEPQHHKKVDKTTLTTLCAVCRGAFQSAKSVQQRRCKYVEFQPEPQHPARMHLYLPDREQCIALPLHGIPAPSAHGEGGIHRGELLGVH